MSPLKSGTAPVEAWANSPDSEIVVHPRVVYPGDDPSDTWIASHRQTGRAINDCYFVDRDDALTFARQIEGLPGFKLIGVERLEDGPVMDPETATALKAEIGRVYDEHCAKQREAFRESAETIP
jgi:hypothetical protein